MTTLPDIIRFPPILTVFRYLLNDRTFSASGTPGKEGKSPKWSNGTNGGVVQEDGDDGANGDSGAAEML